MPGQMTVAMRAMRPSSGPKVLRIGLVVGGRIVEERVVKRRGTVTVGASEESSFVLRAEVPGPFKLFERVGADYHLNFTDAMTGRVALANGVSDLATLRGQAERVGRGYRVRLTEDARGKVTLGDATFLFQFVLPLPAPARPRLPLAVKGGLASAIDWRLTMIAALSFLAHFGLVGAMYSDWSDPIVDEEITAGFLERVERTLPPPEPEPAPPEAQPTDTPTEAPAPDVAHHAVTPAPRPATPTEAQPPKAHDIDALMDVVAKLNIATLTAIDRSNTHLAAALKPGDSVAPVNLNELGDKSLAVNNAPGLLNMPSSAGPIHPSDQGPRLQDMRPQSDVDVTHAGPARPVVVPVDVELEHPIQTVPVANAEATIRRLIHPGAKRCYQKGLESDASQAGKITILIKVAPSGEVDSASVAGNSGLSAGVAACIVGVAKRAKFDPPGGGGSMLSVPFSFVRQ
jgi:hypothetical protein